MKKIVILVSLFSLLFYSCEDFLDSENYTQKNTDNFPRTPEDADMFLVGAYKKLTDVYPLQLLFYASEIMSDNCFGGGDATDTDCKEYNTFSSGGKVNRFRSAWKHNYEGVFRANSVINSIQDVQWKEDEEGIKEKNRIIGEAHFLRAYYFFDLARLFENIPLKLTTIADNLPQAQPEETYAQIAYDLKVAIESLSCDPVSFPSSGRVTKWAAQGWMAKVFLFYTGYYQKGALPLPDGGEVTKQQVIDWLEDCIANSGHDLVEDFRTLWPYSYQTDDPDYARNTTYNYLVKNDIGTWVGDGNKESVFAVKYMALDPGWDGLNSRTNQVSLYYGLRMPANNDSYFQATFPFGRGWGQGTVNSKLWEDWPDQDVRKRGSILNVFDPDEDIWLDNLYGISYQLGAGGQTEETGCWNKKHMPVNAGNRYLGIFENFIHQLYPNVIQDFQRDNLQDIMLMRFADILLMAAELGGPKAKTHFNRVRHRAGYTDDVEPTLENIMNERRFELAFEGSRYYDLLRWHREDLLTTNQTNIKVWNDGKEGLVNVVYRPETRGFMPIPEAEIELSGGVLKENPGW